MAVRKLRSQEAQHDSGAILRSAGREAMQLEYDGQVLTLDVDRGVGRDLFYLPASPTWDDGSPIPHNFATQIKPIITEVEDYWGSTAEFRTVGPRRM
jgi:hypothetical protein